MEKQFIVDSYQIMLERNESLAHKFYQCLFEFEPLLKPMFKKPLALQEKHFNLIIHRAVETINQPELFLLELESLGKKHQGMGIDSEHFKLVKSALILAIQNVLSNQCTKQIIQAWGTYIDQMSAVIKQQI
ncbi:globin domain-containing protein [Neptunicella sp.]|uniref:globin domain-containing protein n=1 Tax=Neptunicella sp. TaxID=2125986 RepID=UPI003F6941B1